MSDQAANNLQGQTNQKALLQRKALLDNQQSQQKQTQVAKEVPKSDAAVKWIVLNQDGKLKLEALPNSTQIDFTTVATHEETISAPKVFTFLGYKINLQAKVEQFTQAYVKNYQMARSHNLMVARFAEFKVAFLGYALSLLGVSSTELQELQKKALATSIAENKVLFKENEYNGELLAIVGGASTKKIKAQKRAIQEIRKQLILHAKRLGLDDYYNQERVVEIQAEQCQKIRDKFLEEKMHLEYQRSYGAMN